MMATATGAAGGPSQPSWLGGGCAVSTHGPSVPITVVVVDDSPAVLIGARAVLDGADGVAVIGCCENGRDAVAAVERLRPDVVVMDLDMPELDGIETCRLITAAHPEAKVLLHTGTDRGRRAQEAVPAGASGVEPKTGDADALIAAVRRTYRRTAW
jgi:DNA-binding NarL/FixJ family response regulator